MNEEKKIIDYLAYLVLKLARGEKLDSNELQSLQNIVDDSEYDFDDENSRDFRW